MYRRPSKCFNFAILIAILIAFAVVASLPTTAQLSSPSHVIVISLDGARPDALQRIGAPHISGLAARGAVDWYAQTILPSVTLPAHASMLTGLSVDEHGLNHNNSTFPCVVLDAPTFVTQAAAAGYRAAMVVGKEKFCQFWQSESVAYSFARQGDRSVVDAAIDYLNAGCEVLFVHFPNPDFFGHSTGWMSEVYLNELRQTDAQVGRLLAALDALNLTDETLIVLTADHGGHGTSHGSNLPEDTTIPWIAAGPGIAPGTTLEGISIADTAPTVLHALGLSVPESALGRVVMEAFTQASAAPPGMG